jgi:hypothetical protein
MNGRSSVQEIVRACELSERLSIIWDWAGVPYIFPGFVLDLQCLTLKGVEKSISMQDIQKFVDLLTRAREEYYVLDSLNDENDYVICFKSAQGSLALWRSMQYCQCNYQILQVEAYSPTLVGDELSLVIEQKTSVHLSPHQANQQGRKKPTMGRHRCKRYGFHREKLNEKGERISFWQWTPKPEGES